MMILGNRVRALREKLGLSQGELADKVRDLGGELSQSQVSTYENSGEPGARRVKRSRYMRELAAALLTTEDYLLKEEATHTDSYAIPAANIVDTKASSATIDQRGQLSGDARDLGATPRYSPELLPIYAATDLGGGLMMLSAQPKLTEVRPHFVADVADAFGLYVATDVMTPAYNRGDRIVISPPRPARDGDDVVLLDRELKPGPARSAIRRLLSRTETHWICMQYKPEKREKFAISEWPICYKIESVRRF